MTQALRTLNEARAQAYQNSLLRHSSPSDEKLEKMYKKVNSVLMPLIFKLQQIKKNLVSSLKQMKSDLAFRVHNMTENFKSALNKMDKDDLKMYTTVAVVVACFVAAIVCAAILSNPISIGAAIAAGAITILALQTAYVHKLQKPISTDINY